LYADKTKSPQNGARDEDDVEFAKPPKWERICS